MKYALFAALMALAACGMPTGPAASGANSSAPGAVDAAHSGVTGGGANSFNKQAPVTD